jgi:indole-3-glycerol phosphate synthase
MNILDKIVAHKKQEVAQRKARYPVKLLEQSIYFETPVVSLKHYLQRPDKSGIIAEFKRRSPSRGDINPYASVERVSIGYMQAGASALSVLTDGEFFGGKNADLAEARKFNFCPILRKDFIIDEYQLIEAKSIGADAILLIAECLDPGQLALLAKQAKGLGLEILMEVHSASQLSKYVPEVDAVGVNNRDLTTFTVDIATSLELVSQLPNDAARVSESGISDPQVVAELKQAGYHGFLIGEHFMKQAEPGKACQEFVKQIRHVESLLDGAIAMD